MFNGEKKKILSYEDYLVQTRPAGFDVLPFTVTKTTASQTKFGVKDNNIEFGLSLDCTKLPNGYNETVTKFSPELKNVKFQSCIITFLVNRTTGQVKSIIKKETLTTSFMGITVAGSISTVYTFTAYGSNVNFEFKY